MADKKMMMDPHDWARHEEEVAKIQAELRGEGVDSCDVGFGPALLDYGVETLRDVFLPVIAELSEGMHVVNFDGRRAYVYRRKNAADIMVRDEAVAWFGEEAVRKIDALIGG
jgi:hypothetical protein